MTRPSAGFFWATLFFLGLVLFATLSVDQKKIDRVVVVGDLTEPQLASVKLELDAMDLTRAVSDVVRERLNDLAWIAKVNIRKNWPDSMIVEITPQTVIAYWNDDAFISKAGEVVVTDLIVAGDLPHLYGPVGTEFEVMTQYQQLTPLLGEHGHEIKVLSLNARNSWSLEIWSQLTRDDVTVYLGKENLRARVNRFLMVSDSLRKAGDERSIETMDARYAHGVAVDFYNNEKLEIADINKREGEQSL